MTTAFSQQNGAAIRVLVTGATGTLGYNVARLLAADPRYHAILPVRRPSPVLDVLGSRVRPVELDLVDAPKMRELIAETQPEVIVHCAASGLRPPKLSWFDLVSFNVETTLRLFEVYCGSSCSRHFVYVSSGLAYTEQGRPLREDDPIGTQHPYGASKAAADLLLQAAAVEFGRSLTIVRPFAFTGLRDVKPRIFPELLLAAAASKPVNMTSGEQVRDFCAVQDIAEGIALCVERTPESLIEIFNLGSGASKTLRESVEGVCDELQLPVKVVFGEIPRPPHDPSHLVADVSVARRVLGWRPKTRVPYAVWQLAQELTPALKLRKPDSSF